MGCWPHVGLLAAGMLGCKPELPPLEYRGERVEVGSDVVDQVCGGTLARLDREVGLIESRLDLPPKDSRLAVVVASREQVDALCPAPAGGCFLDGSVVIADRQRFERVIAHELVHARLATFSAPLITEGIAAAVSPPLCPQREPDIELAGLLAAGVGEDLLGMDGAYYVAGELVAWLIDEFGPAAVLDLMHSVDKDASPSTIDARYREHFDSELEGDYLAHIRTRAELAELPPEHLGCLAPTVDPAHGPIELVADLDCDSSRVHNLFEIDGRGYVEWTLHVDQSVTLDLVGDVQSETSLTIERCRCLAAPGKDKDSHPHPLGERETLAPGDYRLRWVGALDEGHALDVGLEPLD